MTFNSKQEILTDLKAKTKAINLSNQEIDIIADCLINETSTPKLPDFSGKEKILYQLVAVGTDKAYSIKSENFLTIDKVIELIDKITNIPGNIIKPFPLNVIAVYKTLKAIYNLVVLEITQEELVVIYEIRNKLHEGQISIDTYYAFSNIENINEVVNTLVKKKVIKTKNGNITNCEGMIHLFK
jgi:hypothetical protein